MNKNYKKWFELKPKINDIELSNSFHINVGEIWLCSMGENIGIEINGKGDDYLRPVLVIKVFNKNHSWVLPLTSNKKNNSFYFSIPSFSDSTVVLSQLNTISSNRFNRFISKINEEDTNIIVGKLIDILKYETPHKAGNLTAVEGNNTLSLTDENNLSNLNEKDNIEYTSVIQPQNPNKPCVYCSIPEIKAREIIHNELAWAFPTNIPITNGHTLISPIRCVRTLDNLTKEERIAILDLADKIMPALKKLYGAEGFNCVWNEGKLAGQSVPHFHLHIIPRKEGDTGLLGYDPRSMLYRTGDREPMPEVELLKVRDEIRGNM